MNVTQNMQRLTMSTSTEFTIVMGGHVDQFWSEQTGMAPEYDTTTDGAPITILNGKLEDQAMLLGVINGLYNLGYPLMHVSAGEPASAIR